MRQISAAQLAGAGAADAAVTTFAVDAAALPVVASPSLTIRPPAGQAVTFDAVLWK
jgi:hypothetical protein